MNKRVERKIVQIYAAVFKKVFNRNAVSQLSKGTFTPATQNVVILSNSKQYNDFAKKFSKELAKAGLASQRGVWRKYYKAAKEKHYVAIPVSFKQFEYECMSAAVKKNFEMIKSIPNDMLTLMQHKYVSTLIEQVAKNKLSRGSFEAELKKHGSKNAKMIARTETAKLQTAIDESRSRQLGSVAYYWRSSNDKRTRQSHKDMNDVLVFWKPDGQKPLLDGMRGNAGEFPNCRCDIRAVFDEDDIVSTKVYNYNTDKVETMSKEKIKQALEKGELS